MARQISCGHCGGTHGSVAEVRTCAALPHEPPGATNTSSQESEEAPAEHTYGHTDGSVAEPVRHGFSVERLAGPDVLGRSLLTTPGAATPEPWRDAEEIKADADATIDVVERLHQAWRARERLVIRWQGPLPSEESRLETPFHRWAVDQDLPGERLQFAVLANAVSTLGDQPSFLPLRMALDLGASAATDPETGADVVLSDGTEILVDGGPLDLDLTETGPFPVVPRVHLVSGSLRSLSARPVASVELAPDQLAAVQHRGGPARILAPAGSGKTRVLTERARHLVNDCGVNARSVSLVAYNRRAKEEMRTRLTDVAALEIRTLNSLALAIATSSGPFRAGNGGAAGGARTIDELEVRRLLDRVVPGRRRKKLTDPLEPWIDALSACRLGLRDPDEIEQAYGGDVAGFPEVLQHYRDALASAGVLDFDEQILRAISRLMQDPETRRIARSVAPILLVDEFQDLTPAHLLLIRTIAGPAGEIFGVGDDDQTIYGYAGASPEWLIGFERFFPGAMDHRLTVNYRCPAPVVEAAVNLLSHNRQRVTKEITAGTPSGDNPDDDDIADDNDNADDDADRAGLIVLSGKDPQEALVTHVTDLINEGAAPNTVAVLARVNAALLPAAVYLSSAGIPAVRPYGLGPDVLERSGVGAALSWLRLAVGPAQGFASDDLRLALRRPPRSLHPRITDWVCEQRSSKDLLALSQRLNREKEADAVAEFAADIELLRGAVADGQTTEDLLETIYSEIGLLGAASQLDRSQRSARRAAHADELAALAAVARLYPDPLTFEAQLRDQLEAVPIFDPEQPVVGVTLATIHTTKGLEWPHVIVHDVRDGLHPHRLAEDVEEERRIFHVGITRGRQSVAISRSGPPSPFVQELSEHRPADLAWPSDSPVVRSRSAPQPTTKPTSGRSEPTSDAEAGLRESLTEWRRERCKADGVPAYVVLDNKTLDAIAATAPKDLAELGGISGIGPAKLERYGADILGIVASA